MELDIVRVDKKAATVKSLLNKTHIDSKSVFVPNRLGEVELFHGKKGFCVYKDDIKYPVQKYHTDKMVRDMSKEQLQAFLAVGYVCLNQMENGEYSLRANGRINGGGPMLGAAMYWVTKSLCYGTAAAAIGTVAVTTAGVGVAAVTGGAAAVASGAVLSTAGAAAAGTTAITAGAIGTTAGAVVTAGAATTAVVAVGTTAVSGGIAAVAVTGAAIAGTSVGTAAVGVTAVGATVAASSGAAASVGTGAAIVIGIETLSVAVGSFFGMLPTP